MQPTGDKRDADHAARQLLAYTFAPGASFEGQLVGALERVESGGTMRILDALFVGRNAPSGELIAVSMSADGPAGMVGRLLSFRLEPSTRASVTQRALDGPSGQLVRSLADSLEVGGAAIIVLVEHAWEQVLGDAIARMGGLQLSNAFVEYDRIEEAWEPPR